MFNLAVLAVASHARHMRKGMGNDMGNRMGNDMGLMSPNSLDDNGTEIPADGVNDWRSYMEALLEEQNTQREAKGLDAYIYSRALSFASRDHCIEMTKPGGSFNHVLGSSTPESRAAAYGSGASIGENLAAGSQETALGTLNMFISEGPSGGHYKAMFSTDNKFASVWCCDAPEFGRYCSFSYATTGWEANAGYENCTGDDSIQWTPALENCGTSDSSTNGQVDPNGETTTTNTKAPVTTGFDTNPSGTIENPDSEIAPGFGELVTHINASFNFSLCVMILIQIGNLNLTLDGVGSQRSGNPLGVDTLDELNLLDWLASISDAQTDYIDSTASNLALLGGTRPEWGLAIGVASGNGISH